MIVPARLLHCCGLTAVQVLATLKYGMDGGSRTACAAWNLWMFAVHSPFFNNNIKNN